eukprot:g1374.t1
MLRQRATKAKAPKDEDITAQEESKGLSDETKKWKMILLWAAMLVLGGGIAETMSPTAYGRFGLESTITLDSRVGWWLMELPCTVVFVFNFFYIGGPQSSELVPRLLAVVFCIHYFYRGWLFPFMMNTYGATSNFSIIPALFSWIVTITHGYLNAKWFSTHGKHLTRDWIRSPRFVLSAATYYFGLGLVVYHDHLLRNLRPCPNGERYCIPHGGLFDYATCAQYTAELLMWFGFWAMSAGPNGAFIFAISVANLVPRAHSTHMWYLEKFGDAYASLGRDRLIPGVW